MPFAKKTPRYNKMQKLFIDGKEITLIEHLQELRTKNKITKKKISNIVKQNDTWYSQIERNGKNGDDNRQKTIYKPDLINIISIVKYGANNISELGNYKAQSEVYLDKIIRAVPLEESSIPLEWYQLPNSRTPEEQEKLFESLMDSINTSLRQSFYNLKYNDKNDYLNKLKEINASLKLDVCFIISLAGLPFSEFLYEADQNRIDTLLKSIMETMDHRENTSTENNTSTNYFYYNEILDKIKNYIEIAKYTRRNSFEILPVDDMFPNNPNPPK